MARCSPPSRTAAYKHKHRKEGLDSQEGIRATSVPLGQPHRLDKSPEASSTLGRSLCTVCLRVKGITRVICDISIACHPRIPPGLQLQQQPQLSRGGPHHHHHEYAAAARPVNGEQFDSIISYYKIHSEWARTDLSFMILKVNQVDQQVSLLVYAFNLVYDQVKHA